MEARKQVRAPVRVKRTEISVFSACCARTAAPLSDEGRGLKHSFQRVTTGLKDAAPLSDEGRGLKQASLVASALGVAQRPSAMRGED